MDPWSIGVEKALGAIAQGVESSNGSLIQIGIDRLQTRSEMSPELAACFPNACAEAVQEGVAKLWRKAAEAAQKNGSSDQLSWPALIEDLPWMLGIISQQDDWSKLCVEEAVRLLAYSAARCEPLVSAIQTMGLADCIQAASSCFTALSALDRLSRLGEVDVEAQRAVGVMLLAYGMDERSAGAWEKCSNLSCVHPSREDPRLSWPASAGIHPATIVAAIAAAKEVLAPAEPERAPRRTPRG